MSDTPAIFATVDPELINREREAGWPNIHPEDFCHRCGRRNMLWATDHNEWVTGTKDRANQTAHEGIYCIPCFAELHQEATGDRSIWILSKFTPNGETR